MSSDVNLLFAVLALQADLLDNDRFAEACSAWARRRSPSRKRLNGGWRTSPSPPIGTPCVFEQAAGPGITGPSWRRPRPWC
jgi:hypothetical protein